MMDYTNLIDKVNIPKLVKALRSASTVSTAWGKLMLDAAAAIEELEKMLADEYKESEYIVSELESCVRTLTEQRDYWKDKAEKIEMQDKSISKFADGEWWKEAQE